jgi:tetratricopeptide (TPR) repeat protein
MSSADSGQEDIDRTRPDQGSSVSSSGGERKAFKIGPYVVVGRIGQGAMGMVYAAYDEKLDRKVALKLLHSLQDTGTLGPARLLREAQTLARVSHPNVVQVYEVGQHDDEIFVAMEFVRGGTLRTWLREQPRPWPEVLAVYLQAGRGLAAAHAAGVVHRDFKPDNVMLGDDGRVRVMDFGLARAPGRAEPVATTLRSQETSLSPTLTAEGTILGTPAYMAPEQYNRGEIDAQSDQFAYCVALFEALHGQRPFAGEDLRSLAASVRRGEIREPPRRGVPRWLRQIVIRGLAVDPAQRWPSMTALLTRIERGQALARLRLGGALLLALGLAGAGAWGWHHADLARRERACQAAGAGIDAVWNDTVRAQVREAFVKTGVADAADAAERALPWLDRQAAAWKTARTDACLDHDLRGLWSADTLDRSVWCLEDRRGDLEALIAELSRADRSVLQKAVPAAAGLEPVAGCRDPALLARLPALPAEGRDELRAVRAEFSRASGLDAAGRYKEVAEVAAAALPRAEALAWPPLTAEARLWVARSLERQGKYAEAEAALEDAGFAAMEAGALGIAADAANALVMVVGQKLARFDDGLRWARFAELALADLEPQPGLRSAARLGAIAVVRSMTGDFAEARTLQERALALHEQALGPEHPRVASALGNLALTHMSLGEFPEALAINGRSLALREAALGPEHHDVARVLSNRAVILRNMGKLPEALAINRRVLATSEKILGPEHPDVAVTLTNIANIDVQLFALDEALAMHERALKIREQALGPDHPDVAASLSNLGTVHLQSGRYALARAPLERALKIREQVFGPEHREVATSLGNLALLERYVDAPQVARRLQERALAILEKVAGPEHPSLVPVLVNLGELDYEADAFTAAKAHYERGLAILEKAFGPDHPNSEPALAGLARVALATGRPADALQLAGRSVAAAEARGASEIDLADSRFVLARALWDAPADAGRDRGRALAQARRARDAFRGLKEAEPQAAAVERWLAKRRD